mmetsp:Transcript_27300/g.79996  ORF Transcript_27300/g.79996 Transcript_27300/m.79996 type:complete len:204 (-) Transcript_27300:275-886(-)
MPGPSPRPKRQVALNPHRDWGDGSSFFSKRSLTTPTGVPLVLLYPHVRHLHHLQELVLHPLALGRPLLDVLLHDGDPLRAVLHEWVDGLPGAHDAVHVLDLRADVAHHVEPLHPEARMLHVPVPLQGGSPRLALLPLLHGAHLAAARYLRRQPVVLRTARHAADRLVHRSRVGRRLPVGADGEQLQVAGLHVARVARHRHRPR